MYHMLGSISHEHLVQPLHHGCFYYHVFTVFFVDMFNVKTLWHESACIKLLV